MSFVTACIVVYKTPCEELEQLFRLLQTSTDRLIRWVVVDNAAEEEPIAAQALKASAEAHGGAYVPSCNIGFGAGHNLGFKELRGNQAPFHLMLNPDILFTPGAIEKLLRVLEQHPEAVRIMPRVVFPDGREQHLCKLLPSPLDVGLRRFLPKVLSGFFGDKLAEYELRGLPHVANQNIPFLSGCFILVRSKALENIGGFDDRYFLYMEDVDLCRRLATQGTSLYWPDISVTHAFHRGSHHSLKLTLLHIRSSIQYFNRWGWIFDRERTRANRKALQSIGKGGPTQDA